MAVITAFVACTFLVTRPIVINAPLTLHPLPISCILYVYATHSNGSNSVLTRASALSSRVLGESSRLLLRGRDVILQAATGSSSTNSNYGSSGTSSSGENAPRSSSGGEGRHDAPSSSLAVRAGAVGKMHRLQEVDDEPSTSTSVRGDITTSASAGTATAAATRLELTSTTSTSVDVESGGVSATATSTAPPPTSTSTGGARVILKDVSFTIRAGTTTAVVGPTGTGKSTLSRLLFRCVERVLFVSLCALGGAACLML